MKEILFYRCNVCGKIVMVMEDSSPDPVCCGEDMEMLFPGTGDGAGEKHVPAVQISEDEIRVTVGSEPHPMKKDHYIQWIMILTDKGILIRELSPADAPEAVFRTSPGEKFVSAWEYCTVHGLWKAE